MRGGSTVYFLGAGASADSGVPLTDALLGKIVRHIKLKEKRSALFRFIKTFGFLERGTTARPPIVDVVSLLDTCLRQNLPLDQFFTLDRLRRVRTQLTLELSRVVEGGKGLGAKFDKVRMPPDARDQPGARGRQIARYFKHFVQGLRPRNREVSAPLKMGDAVITTNYDTNIDVALYELVYADESGWKLENNIISDVFLGSDFRDPYDDTDALSDRKATVDLLKLSGSLNWLYCPRCCRIYVAAFGFSVRFVDRSSRDERTCHCGYYSLEPVIVAPSGFQEIVNPHLQAIWMNAYHVLESADTWVFVGYSLPQEDLAVRSLLHRAKSGRWSRRGKVPNIRVVCPKKSIDKLRPQYVGLLGKSVKFDGRRFIDYVYDR